MGLLAQFMPKKILADSESIYDFTSAKVLCSAFVLDIHSRALFHSRESLAERVKVHTVFSPMSAPGACIINVDRCAS